MTLIESSSLAGVVAAIAPCDPRYIAEAQRHLDDLTKPQGSLGRLEAIAAQMYAIFSGNPPRHLRRGAYVFAADHGVTAEGVSAYPREVTAQMVRNFLNGGAAINVLARLHESRRQVRGPRREQLPARWTCETDSARLPLRSPPGNPGSRDRGPPGKGTAALPGGCHGCCPEGSGRPGSHDG